MADSENPFRDDGMADFSGGGAPATAGGDVEMKDNVFVASHTEGAAVGGGDALLSGELGDMSMEAEEASNAEEGRWEGEGSPRRARLEQPTGMCACLSLAYFRPYFNVDTVDVRDRVTYGIWPIGRAKTFRNTLEGNPDLYGPFWLSATLVFAIAATSNVSSYLHFTATNELEQWTYDFTIMTLALGMVCGFTFGAPFVMWTLMRYFGVPMGLVELICTYGYSLASFIPASIVCALPSSVMAWLSIAAAVAMSLFMLWSELNPLVQEHAPADKRIFLLGVMAGGHALYALLLKFFFFHHA